MKYSINSIKLETIYHINDQYIDEHEDTYNLLRDLELHYILPPEHFIPYRFINNPSIPETNFSYFITAFYELLNHLSIQIEVLDLNHPDRLDDFINLTAYHDYLLSNLQKYFPTYF